MPRRISFSWLALLITVVAVQGMAGADAADRARPVSVRVRWGGGTPQAWAGRIAVVATDSGRPPQHEWQTLSGQRDGASATYDLGGSVIVNQSISTASDGVELTIQDWHRARLIVSLGPGATGAPTATLDLPVTDIFANPIQRPLDSEGNRLTIEQTPGDELQVDFEESPTTLLPLPFGSVRKPGDRIRFRITPLMLMKPGGGDVELRARLSPARQTSVIDSRIIPIAAGLQRTDITTPSGQIPTTFNAVSCEFTLPNEEGAFDIVLEAVERRGLRWNRQLAERRFQVVAIADEPPPQAVEEPWKIVYDLDPGSPRLHERLRRLPGRGLQAVPRPSMPLPSFTRPSLSMPRMPDVPLPTVPMPAVPLPDMTSFVPRLGGLLASGHSTVTPHPLGPMLRLPAATATKTHPWEGIVIATPRAGVPHVVEIDYPTDQQATIATCVFESDATGSLVEVRHAGGVEVVATPYDVAARIATHRFVFWPTTRQPLLVIANPTTSGPALVSRVRVQAGPTSLPADRPSKGPTISTAEHRRAFALMPSLDLAQRYGGPTYVDSKSGRPTTDWVSHLIAIRHSVDAIRSQGLAGSVVTAYSGGIAAWPSRLTRAGPRWPSASPSDDHGHDLLSATARIYARERVAFVPGLCFNGPIPSLETLRAGADGVGIACVGADGRPRTTAGTTHYNILDPRVQQAVEDLVAEAVTRLDGNPAFAGIAILLPEDGWLHLPGVAWGLDDATFGRFLAAIGEHEAEQGDDRFAARGRLVTGPLRHDWLAWRSSELATFYARLATRTGDGAARKLFVVPTTLLAAGDLAVRFRPTAATPMPADDLLREFGLVATLPEPSRSNAFVFVSPQVTAAATTLADRSTVAAANSAIARAASTGGQARPGAAMILRPVEVNLAEVLPHGPFPSATLSMPCRAFIEPSSAQGDAMLAKALAPSDAVFVFDMRPAMTNASSQGSLAASLEAFPAMPFDRPVAAPAPLAVRMRVTTGRTVVQVINAGPAPADATLELTGPVAAVVDASGGDAMPMSGDRVTVSLTPWAVRAFVIDGTGTVSRVTTSYPASVRGPVEVAIERARQRLGVLAAPEPLDVLDNPSFELGLADATAARMAPAVTGWELLEPRRGDLGLIPGLDTPAGTSGRGLRFSSRNGLSTVRSNPFRPPATGRISVAAWLRLDPGEPQPPLRIAIEGVEANREYYRFAPVGGLAGSRPLTTEWALFVLQVDDLPAESVESLRVRFDLLGPGSVQLDEVRVYDLAFDESQRSEIAKTLAGIDHRFKTGDVGAAIMELAGHWPTFLEAFVSDAAVVARNRAVAEPQTAVAPSPPDEPRQGMLDRFRGWW